MTQAEHNLNAKTFIDNQIANSKKPYNELMNLLQDKIEEWDFEKWSLSLINLFEISDEDCNLMNYLTALISYGNRLVVRNRLLKTFVTDGYKIEFFDEYNNKGHKPKTV